MRGWKSAREPPGDGMTVGWIIFRQIPSLLYLQPEVRVKLVVVEAKAKDNICNVSKVRKQRV